MNSNPHINRHGDAAAGPVPVTAWPAPPTGCTPAEAACVAISRLTATYTRAGQVVIDLHPTPTRLAAITQTRRRVIAVTNNPAQAKALLEEARPARHAGPKHAVQVWLTDEPAVRLAASARAAGLILADPADPNRLPAGVKSWAASARRALRPGGRLAVMSGPDQARPVSLIEVAEQMGLAYTEHIIQLAAPLAGHPPRPGQGHAPADSVTTASQLRAHVDVFLFTALRGDGDGSR